jgi:Flp pilus assembly pilin Flp
MTGIRRITRSDDRGATLVEYALIIALVVVASLGAIATVESRGKSQLAGSGARVTPAADSQYYASSGTPSSIPATTSTTTAGLAVHLGSSPTTVVQDDASKWNVTVTFKIVDSTNAGVIGARLNANFNDGSGQPTAVTCTTSTASGLCTVQLININDNATPVTLTVTSITGSGMSWDGSADPERTRSVACAPPLSAGCD